MTPERKTETGAADQPPAAAQTPIESFSDASSEPQARPAVADKVSDDLHATKQRLLKGIYRLQTEIHALSDEDQKERQWLHNIGHASQHTTKQDISEQRKSIESLEKIHEMLALKLKLTRHYLDLYPEPTRFHNQQENNKQFLLRPTTAHLAYLLGTCSTYPLLEHRLLHSILDHLTSPTSTIRGHLKTRTPHSDVKPDEIGMFKESPFIEERLVQYATTSYGRKDTPWAIEESQESLQGHADTLKNQIEVETNEHKEELKKKVISIETALRIRFKCITDDIFNYDNSARYIDPTKLINKINLIEPAVSTVKDTPNDKLLGVEMPPRTYTFNPYNIVPKISEYDGINKKVFNKLLTEAMQDLIVSLEKDAGQTHNLIDTHLQQDKHSTSNGETKTTGNDDGQKTNYSDLEDVTGHSLADLKLLHVTYMRLHQLKRLTSSDPSSDPSGNETSPYNQIIEELEARAKTCEKTKPSERSKQQGTNTSALALFRRENKERPHSDQSTGIELGEMKADNNNSPGL